MRADKFEMLTRAGFAARGILYILIGFLAVTGGRAKSPEGALDYMNGGAGKLLIGLMAIGFAAYGLWRLSEAVLDSGGHGRDARGMGIRAGGFVSGLIHLVLALYAARLALGSSGHGGSANGAEQGAATALAFPGGETLLVIVAGVLLVTGLFQLSKAARLRFLRHLDQRAARMDWVRWAGALGYAARGLVFLMAAWLLWKAARAGSSEQVADMGEALGSLPGSLQTAAGAGLLLFGIFSLVEARYRRIDDPQLI